MIRELFGQAGSAIVIGAVLTIGAIILLSVLDWLVTRQRIRERLVDAALQHEDLMTAAERQHR